MPLPHLSLLFSLSVLVLLYAYQYSFPLPSPLLRPKIFVIGLSKTGTTSIGDALEKLGYRRLGWTHVRSRVMVHTWINGDRTTNLELTHLYDAFEDLPWPIMYRKMAETYPDAKFILSRRRDEATWLRSMRVHMGRGKWEPYSHFFGADTFEGNEEIIRASYVNHTQDVQSFFADKPGRMVEMNIDDGDANWEVLCRVAECPGGQAPSQLSFPRSNTKAAWEGGVVVENLHWYWGWTVTRLEEQIVHHFYRSELETVKAVLRAVLRVYLVCIRGWYELYYRGMPVVRMSSRMMSTAQDALSR
jgi:hypothetical protein